MVHNAQSSTAHQHLLALQILDTRFQHSSSFVGKLEALLTMKIPLDSHGAPLEYTADQLVRVAFQLRVEEAFDKVGTAV